jgi:hypothetical protein
MPLTELQFNLRITPQTEAMMRRVHAFLRGTELAYNEEELCDEFGLPRNDETLHTAVRELTFLGGVDARGDEMNMYYRYLDPIPEFED